jgi:hypothetical protein
MLVVADDSALPSDARVWGTGGWLPPHQREALDWLTLARLSGWNVAVARHRPGTSASLEGGNRWIVLTCDPDALSEGDVAHLASRVSCEPIVLITRAALPGTPLARLSDAHRLPDPVAGRRLRWTGPGTRREWCCRSAMTAETLMTGESIEPWMMLEESPVIVSRRYGRGMVATLGFHPSEWRDQEGAATAVLKHLLVWGALAPIAWLDWERTLVLRMDDPGGAQNVFSRTWRYPKLMEQDWGTLAADLRTRDARLSIGYVAGWVDDGDPRRGELTIAGRSATRTAGAVYPSPEVVYRDVAGHAPETVYDYRSEFRGIQRLRAAGAGDVELHGHTHLHPDATAWATSADRYDDESWYRELGERAAEALARRAADQHPLALGMAAFERHFGTRPTTLICPGDQWTSEALERALDLGIELVASYYLAIRHRNRFCWTTHVCAPYLDEPAAEWLDAGLPVIGYFHDREPALEGVGWIQTWLDEWRSAGARRLIDFRELSSAIGLRFTAENRSGSLRLHIDSSSSPDLVRPVHLTVRVPGGLPPPVVSVAWKGVDFTLDVDPQEIECGRVTLPVASRPVREMEISRLDPVEP